MREMLVWMGWLTHDDSSSFDFMLWNMLHFQLVHLKSQCMLLILRVSKAATCILLRLKLKIDFDNIKVYTWTLNFFLLVTSYNKIENNTLSSQSNCHNCKRKDVSKIVLYFWYKE
jgi:hypothetical protein